ncbi:helix-turn-helix transcriptional regulator [Gluconobacter sp. GP1]|uniref:helix-turn-helix domain-containing protein n=1 Tax=Gluconobacter sp. GP1 TaxID=3046423 RepID=UPI00293E41C5|nr:helix-turn-helix transcriptional regulator [Gluconobacter sp. GP1]
MRKSPQSFSDLPLFSRDCRAARNLRGWSQDDLAKRAKVGRATIMRFESESSIPTRRVLEDLRIAFKEAGIIFETTENGKRSLIDTASWLVLLGDNVDLTTVGDEISVMARADGTLVCVNQTRNSVISMAATPKHGQHAPSYAKNGDKGIVFEVHSRPDPEYGQVTEIAYAPQ